MSLAYFLAKRIHFSHNIESGTQRVSPPAIRIAIAGIAIGLAVMILSVAIVIGFKTEVREKIVGFGAHLQVTALTNNMTFEMPPITVNDTLMNAIKGVEGVSKAQPFLTKPAIIKTDNDFLSVVVKGITGDSDETFFKQHLCEGQIETYAPWSFQDSPKDDEDTSSNEIVISRIIAQKLRLQVGDNVQIFFIKQEMGNEFAMGNGDASIKSRKLQISGIYETYLNEYDKQIVIADIRLLQDVSDWKRNQAGGVEVSLADFNQLETAQIGMFEALDSLSSTNNDRYICRSIVQTNPQIFSWLDLLDTNVWVILILISCVAGFTMISGLLIIILERTKMIGILKALGYNNFGIRKVFLYIATFLIGKGLIWGNVIGITLCLLQKYGHFIKLDPENYYLQYVPIEFNPIHILLLNIGTIVITLCVLLVPSALVASINPTKAIQSE